MRNPSQAAPHPPSGPAPDAGQGLPRAQVGEAQVGGAQAGAGGAGEQVAALRTANAALLAANQALRKANEELSRRVGVLEGRLSRKAEAGDSTESEGEQSSTTGCGESEGDPESPEDSSDEGERRPRGRRKKQAQEGQGANTGSFLGGVAPADEWVRSHEREKLLALYDHPESAVLNEYVEEVTAVVAYRWPATANRYRCALDTFRMWYRWHCDKVGSGFSGEALADPAALARIIGSFALCRAGATSESPWRGPKPAKATIRLEVMGVVSTLNRAGLTKPDWKVLGKFLKDAGIRRTVTGVTKKAAVWGRMVRAALDEVDTNSIPEVEAAAGIAVGFWTLLRKSSVRELEWGQVSFRALEEGRRLWVFSLTKGSKGRRPTCFEDTVPDPEEASACHPTFDLWLERWKRIYETARALSPEGSTRPGDWVFPRVTRVIFSEKQRAKWRQATWTNLQGTAPALIGEPALRWEFDRPVASEGFTAALRRFLAGSAVKRGWQEPTKVKMGKGRWRWADPWRRFSFHSLRVGGATEMALKGISDAARKKKGLWRSSADLMYVLTMTEELAEASLVIGTPGLTALGREGAESRVKRWFLRQDECGCVKCWLGQGPGCGTEACRAEEGAWMLRESAPEEPEPRSEVAQGEVLGTQTSTATREVEEKGRGSEPTVREERPEEGCPKCGKRVARGWKCKGSCAERWHKQCIGRARPKLRAPPSSVEEEWWCGRCAGGEAETESQVTEEQSKGVRQVRQREKETCNYARCRYKSLTIKKPLRCSECEGVWHTYCAIDREGRPTPRVDEDGDDLPWWCGSCPRED